MIGSHASRLLVVVGLLVGCTESGEPPRTVDVEATVGANGFSDPFTIDVPEGTRSVTIVATGGTDALYALGSFQTADGVEHVGIDLATPPGSRMRESYDTEQIGQMPGMLFQTIRLGTFTHVYPYRPDQILVPGKTTLRIASDKPGTVQVRVLMPPDDGGKVLHVNLFVVSDMLSIAQPAPFLDELQAIFGQVGITIVVDETRMIPGSGLARITQSTEPQEAPGSQSARLPALAKDPLSPGALDIFIVESLTAGIGGLSLGTPGPPVRDSYYYGVVIRYSANEMAMATVVAHEASHFLALQHVTNTGISGTVYPDPLDDTQPGQSNLMQSGTALTADQGFALSRSALLSVD